MAASDKPPSTGEATRPCAEVLLDVLARQPAVEGASFDPSRRELTLDYDPTRISPDRLSTIAKHALAEIADEQRRCPARRTGARCEDCPRLVASSDKASSLRWQSNRENNRSFGVAPPAGRFLEHYSVRPRDDAATRAPLAPELIKQAVPVAMCGVLLLAGWFADAGGRNESWWLYLAACLIAGLPTLLSTLASLARRVLDVDLLMLLGAVGAALAGHPDEAAVLLFLFTLSEALETYAMGRTRRAIESLMALRPDEATILEDGAERRVRLEEVPIGAKALIRPGDRIPLDGLVESGASDVDESSLTGEPMPVAKQAGAAVMAGSIALDGQLVVRTTRLAKESTLARVIDLVESARESRAPTERMLDRYLGRYVVIVLAGSALAALAPIVTGMASASTALYRAMTLLVVASPCALVISTPATILSAIAAAARRGILFKGGASVEILARADLIAFDKTGTLTDGVLTVVEVAPLGRATRADVIRLAAAAEGYSEHPLARAVLAVAKAEGIAVTPPDQFRALPGRGVEATIAGTSVLVGNARFLMERGVDAAAMPSAASGASKKVGVAQGGELIGLIELGDRLRPEAAGALAALRAMGIARVAMLTGDEEGPARQLAEEAGIDDVRAGLLPEEKVEALASLASGAHVSVMVGDGVNDAPALAAATLGVAMGAAGTDVALETADIVLMASRLDRLVDAVAIARLAQRRLKENLVFAMVVLTVLVVLTLSDVTGLTLGVIGHEGSTLLVVLNGLRTLAFRR